VDHIADLLRYYAEVVQYGDALNQWLNDLPWEIQEAALAIGEWLAALLGY
jgi:hypothetical protein